MNMNGKDGLSAPAQAPSNRLTAQGLMNTSSEPHLLDRYPLFRSRSPDEASALDEMIAGAASAPTPTADVFRKPRRLRSVCFFT